MTAVSLPRSLWIIIKSAAITLWISLRTLLEAYTGRFQRSEGDARLRWWSSRLLKYVGATYRVHNPHGFQFQPGTPYILMSNHSSHYDIPLIFMALPGSIRMLTKKELFAIPIWGRGMRAAEFISIDRHNRKQALRDLEAAKAKMESGIILWIAPEGTRSRNGSLLPFKKGGFRLALDTKATILPISIQGAHKVLPAKTISFSYGQHVDIHIGRPIDAAAYSGQDVDGLIYSVRQQLEKLGGYVD